MYDYHCGRCGGLVPEPMKAYGYAGKWCHCKNPLPPTEETSTRKFIGLDERGHENNEPTQYVEVLEEETPVYTTTYAFGVVPDTPKTVEEMVAELAPSFSYKRKGWCSISMSDWLKIKEYIATLQAQNQAADERLRKVVKEIKSKADWAEFTIYDTAEAVRLEDIKTIAAKHGITNL